jgi:hypothetical protein
MVICLVECIVDAKHTAWPVEPIDVLVWLILNVTCQVNGFRVHVHVQSQRDLGWGHRRFSGLNAAKLATSLSLVFPKRQKSWIAMPQGLN